MNNKVTILKRMTVLASAALTSFLVGCSSNGGFPNADGNDNPNDNGNTPEQGFDYIRHSGAPTGGYAELEAAQQVGVYQLANRNVFENPEQAGNRQAELATAITDYVADFTLGKDLDVFGLDVDGLYDTPELRQKLIEAAVVSIAHRGSSVYNVDAYDNLFDNSDAVVVRAAKNNENPSAGVGCETAEMVAARDYNLTDRADAMLVVGSASKMADGAEVDGTSRCSRPSVVAENLSQTGEVPYIYWMDESEYRSHLNDVAGDYSADQIEAKVGAYRGLIDSGVAKPGQMITGVADNANAAAQIAGTLAAARVMYPNLTEQELVTATIIAADYENMTLNGGALGAGNNGAGLGYNKTHSGFGIVTPQAILNEAAELSEFKASNPDLSTTPVRSKVQAGEFLQLLDNSDAIYVAIIPDNVVANRLMMQIELEQALPEGQNPLIQMIGPSGQQYDLRPSVHGNLMSISTDEVFGMRGEGYWIVRMGDGLKPVNSKFDFTIAGVEQGGVVDEYMKSKGLGDDSLINLGPSPDINGLINRLTGQVLGSNQSESAKATTVAQVRKPAKPLMFG